MADTTIAPGHEADAAQAAAEAFVAKWQGVAASELSTSQSFLIDLCGLLGVELRVALGGDLGAFSLPMWIA